MKLTRRGFMKTVPLWSIPFVAAQQLQDGPGLPPNILLIVTDQQHADAIAALGNKGLRTPAMDSLVRGGTAFRRSYTTNPVCSPARSSVLTGRMPSETGVYKNGMPIRSDIPNIGEWLSSRAGYESVYAGKWHMPRSYSATLPGFRVLHTGIGGFGVVCDTAVSMACASYILNRPDDAKPFCMVASFMQPHDICEWLRHNTTVPDEMPYPGIEDQLPELPDNFEYDEREPVTVSDQRKSREGVRGNWPHEHWRYYRWSYNRHIEQVDGEIGRVLDALRMKDLDRNTLVIFTSDHGEGLGHHQMVRKSTPYDEAARVPMVVSMPGTVKRGAGDGTHLVSGVDIVPTICDYAGVDAPAGMRGLSMRPLLEGQQTKWRSHIVVEHNNDTGRSIVSERYKYALYRGDDTEMLFDLEKDPLETNNLTFDRRHKEAVRQHREMLCKWEKALDVDSERLPDTAGWAGKLS